MHEPRPGPVRIGLRTSDSQEAAPRSAKRFRVHPIDKTKYRVTDWREYDRRLVDRGDLTLWISQDAIEESRTTPGLPQSG